MYCSLQHLAVVCHILGKMQVDLVLVMGWGIIVIIIILGIIKMFLVFPGLLELKLTYGEEVVEIVKNSRSRHEGIKHKKESSGVNVIKNVVDEKARNDKSLIRRKISQDYGEYFSLEIHENSDASDLAIVKHIENVDDSKAMIDIPHRQN